MCRGVRMQVAPKVENVLRETVRTGPPHPTSQSQELLMQVRQARTSQVWQGTLGVSVTVLVIPHPANTPAAHRPSQQFLLRARWLSPTLYSGLWFHHANTWPLGNIFNSLKKENHDC